MPRSPRTADPLSEGGARPLAVASYVRVASEAVDDGGCVADGLAHAALAADLGCRFLRVFSGAGSPGPRADDRAARRLRAIAGQLPAGVTVLLETHDSHPRRGRRPGPRRGRPSPGESALGRAAPVGTGSVPLTEALTVLRANDYVGALCLEWEAKWYAQAPPLAEALARGDAWLAATLASLDQGA